MDVPQPERILIVRLSHLGDVVHGLPLLRALRLAWPEAELGWIVQPEFAPLLEGVPGLDRVLGFDRRAGITGWWRARRALRAWGPDWTVDSQGNAKSASLALASGARVRIGYARQDWRERWFARFATHQAAPAYGPHALHRVEALIERAAPGVDPSPVFELGLTDDELTAGRAALEARLPAGGGPILLLHLGAPGDRRSWPTPHWSSLAERLSAAGARVLLVSGPEEATIGRELAEDLSTREDIGHWIDQRGLRLLAAAFHAAAEADGRLIGTDSGPAHVAVAVGLPVTMLSGPQDPARTGPWPPPGTPDSPHRVLRGEARTTAALEPGEVARAVLAELAPDAGP